VVSVLPNESSPTRNCTWFNLLRPISDLGRSSGVPQGSILGPVLFALYVLPDAVTSIQVAMFADDTKMFATIRTEDDCERLQSDLDNLRNWSSISDPPFNETKCKSNGSRGSLIS
jgi:hypothetical protein